MSLFNLNHAELGLLVQATRTIFKSLACLQVGYSLRGEMRDVNEYQGRTPCTSSYTMHRDFQTGFARHSTRPFYSQTRSCTYATCLHPLISS